MVFCNPRRSSLVSELSFQTSSAPPLKMSVTKARRGFKTTASALSPSQELPRPDDDEHQNALKTAAPIIVPERRRHIFTAPWNNNYIEASPSSMTPSSILETPPPLGVTSHNSTYRFSATLCSTEGRTKSQSPAEREEPQPAKMAFI